VAAPTLYRIPTTIVAGDTMAWTDDRFTDYPASEGWTLTTEIVGSATDLGTFTASASGDNYVTTIAAATTAAWTAADYSFQQFVTLSGARYLVNSGTVTVKANLATATTHDGRSHVKTTLDAIEAVLESKATKDQASYSIAGRALTTYSWEELIAMRSKYRQWYEAEQQAWRVEQGLGTKRKITTRFT
jgi:hypothetical protein